MNFVWNEQTSTLGLVVVLTIAVIVAVMASKKKK